MLVSILTSIPTHITHCTQHKHARTSHHTTHTNTHHTQIMSFSPPPSPRWDTEPDDEEAVKRSLLSLRADESQSAGLILHCATLRGKYPTHYSCPAEPPSDTNFDPMTPTVIEEADLDKVRALFTFQSGTCTSAENKTFEDLPTYADFVDDLTFVMDTANDGPARTFAYRRLKVLESKFTLHYQTWRCEERAQLNGNGTDFFQICKVDTHVHLAGAVPSRVLLKFIKDKLENESTRIVLKNETGEHTLKEVLDQLQSDPTKLNVDQMETTAEAGTFQRFDVFNRRFSPFNNPDIRTIFLKSDNYINGDYYRQLAAILVENLEAGDSHTCKEYRISIYGRDRREWDRLADWLHDQSLNSPHVRWLIQVPRLYHLYKKKGQVDNFGQIMENIFGPLLEVTLKPSSHPKLHRVLPYIVGFDSVDNESLRDLRPHRDSPLPDKWNGPEDPTYAYYLFYMWKNIHIVNTLRSARGLTTFSLRPHSGEAGHDDHLGTTFLLADSINHGLGLKKAIVLQYLYYLEQIGLAMSPLSNNALFEKYFRNPLPKFFRRGLNVSLSTDDPLQFHFTLEPLLEEYSQAAQTWHLGMVDLCEIARNSVRQSSFDLKFKHKWLGSKYDEQDPLNPKNNNVQASNVPRRRLKIRHQTLNEEKAYLHKIAPPKEDLQLPIPKSPSATEKEAQKDADKEAGYEAVQRQLSNVLVNVLDEGDDWV
eukprot:m.170116 g.170116  ORF g.170116 m.170116 type:complete len:706 (+) comp25139_c0_seq1:109-2226(+)